MTNARATADAPDPAAGGLRPRKRERTRCAISDAAFRLFAERGFDAVKLTEIALAADVAPATVFTHFGSKEDIFFSRRDEFNAGLPAAVELAATGAELLLNLRQYLDDSVELVLADKWLDSSRTFSRVLLGSEALRRSHLAVLRQREDLLLGLLVQRAGDRVDPGELRIFAGFTAAVRGAVFELLHRELAAQAPAAEIRARVRALVDRGFARLAAAYAGDPLLEPGDRGPCGSVVGGAAGDRGGAAGDDRGGVAGDDRGGVAGEDRGGVAGAVAGGGGGPVRVSLPPGTAAVR